MSDQLGLLDQWEQDTEEAARREEARRRVESHRRLRRVCWPEWEGPRAGGLCQVAGCFARREDGVVGYYFTELCRLLEQRDDGTWLAVVEMGEITGEPWHKDGTRLILEDTDIWPPVRQLSKARRAES